MKGKKLNDKQFWAVVKEAKRVQAKHLKEIAEHEQRLAKEKSK